MLMSKVNDLHAAVSVEMDKRVYENRYKNARVSWGGVSGDEKEVARVGIISKDPFHIKMIPLPSDGESVNCPQIAVALCDEFESANE